MKIHTNVRSRKLAELAELQAINKKVQKVVAEPVIVEEPKEHDDNRPETEEKEEEKTSSQKIRTKKTKKGI